MLVAAGQLPAAGPGAPVVCASSSAGARHCVQIAGHPARRRHRRAPGDRARPVLRLDQRLLPRRAELRRTHRASSRRGPRPCCTSGRWSRRCCPTGSSMLYQLNPLTAAVELFHAGILVPDDRGTGARCRASVVLRPVSHWSSSQRRARRRSARLPPTGAPLCPRPLTPSSATAPRSSSKTSARPSCCGTRIRSRRSFIAALRRKPSTSTSTPSTT